MTAALARRGRDRVLVLVALLALLLAGDCSPTRPQVGYRSSGTLDSYAAPSQVTLAWNVTTAPDCIDPPCPAPGPPIDHVVVLRSRIGPSSGWEQVSSVTGSGAGSTTVTGLSDGATYWFKVVAIGSFGQRLLETTPVMTMPGPITEAATGTPLDAQSGFDWSPDGREIAYIDDTVPLQSNIHVLDVATLASRPVTFFPSGDAHLLGVSWSRDGQSLIFTRTPTLTAGEIDYRVWQVGLDEYAPHPITPGRVDFDGSFGGAGWIYFCRGTPGPPNVPEIWRTDPLLDGPEPLTGDRQVRKYHPSARAADDLIVYAGSPVDGAGRKLYLLSPDGKRPVPLTTDRYYEDNVPSWSPDGRSVVFISNRSGHGEAWSIDVGSHQLTQLTRGVSGTQRQEARWSPDGRRLAVLGWPDSNGPRRLDIIDLSTPLP